MSPQETIYYQALNVTITNARAVLGPKTYPMSNIMSVSYMRIPPNRTLGIMVMILSSLFSLCVCVPAVFAGLALEEQPDVIWAVVLFGGFTLVGLLMAFIGFIVALMAGPKYVVRIGTSYGEVNALFSKNFMHVKQIVDAMNQAIIDRG